MFTEIFAQRLRILRKAMKYSMDTFVTLYNAKYETKMTKYALARYEKGEQMPSYTALLNLADFFHVPVDYLTGRDAPVPTANTPETNTPSLAEPPIMPIYKMEGKKNGIQKYRVRVNYVDSQGRSRQIDRVAYGNAEARALEAKLIHETKEAAPAASVTVQTLYAEYMAALARA